MGLEGACPLQSVKLASLEHLNMSYRGRCVLFSFYIFEEGEQIDLAKVTSKLMAVGCIPGSTWF